MGRKTWDSLPVKPLPSRINFVISGSGYAKEMSDYLESVEVWSVDGIKAAIGIAYSLSAGELCIIGGASIYEQFLPRATHMILTHINGEYGCDKFFPEFDKDDWTLTSGKQFTTDALVRYWERKQ